MPTFDDAFDEVRTALNQNFGPAANEFEGRDPFEAMVGVVLSRAAGGGRLWKAGLEGLAKYDLIEAERLAEADTFEIVDALREKGLAATPKTVAPLKHMARRVVGGRERGSSPVDEAASGEMVMPVASLRVELAEIKGIGPAGADAIILFALKQPSYPVDRATFRVLVRHGWIDSTATYDEARDLLVSGAERAGEAIESRVAAVLTDLSHGMERLGRQFCRAATAHCRGCPLERLLPDGGPREIDA